MSDPRIQRSLRAGLLALGAFLSLALPARADTFSIAAVDVQTGHIGSAGASCVGPLAGVGAFILSDIMPGVGVIHTQAAYVSGNQRNARARMLAGDSPQQIVDYLAANDVRGSSASRQYGIVDLRREGESAAFTGQACTDWAGHRTGTGYAVQGNILSGPEIVEDMEAAYLETEGELAERLMAALEAAKVVGADWRCADRGSSSQSGFIRVMRPEDGAATYLQLVVPDSEPGQDPIDLLREQYEAWKLAPTITPGATLTPLPSPTPSLTPTPEPEPIYLPLLSPSETGWISVQTPTWTSFFRSQPTILLSTHPSADREPPPTAGGGRQAEAASRRLGR